MAQNIDELEVKILIIAKHPKNMKNTCEYLARHGWTTTCMSSLPKALEFIKNERPDIVLLSFNHPSESIYKLPDLFEQGKEILCIGIVEGTDVISANTLTAVKIKHKIFGQPSGPNMQRGISLALSQWVPVNRKPKPVPQVVAPVPAPEPAAVVPVKPVGTVQDRAKSAIGTAFARLCPPNALGTVPSPLMVVRKVGVFRFDSSEIPGYLVLAQNPLTATVEFLKLCETSLTTALLSTDLKGKLGEGFFMDFPEVEFKSWAAESGAFNLVFDHLGVELGVAFFQAAAPLPQPRALAGMNMMGVNVSQMPEGHALPFKLYLHMKANQKFYMYLRDGRELRPEQRHRLIKRQISELYIQTPDLEKLQRFWALVYLQESMLSGLKSA